MKNTPNLFYMKESPTFHDLEAYRLAFQLSMNILKISGKFPATEGEPLKKKLLRSSTTIAVKIAEGWCKRKNPNTFSKYLMDAQQAAGETKACLSLGLEYGYFNISEYIELLAQYEALTSKMSLLNVQWKVAV